MKTRNKVEDKGKVRVLVYGTLKKDHGNHGLIEAANGEFLGRDSVTGHFKMVNFGTIPAVVPTSDNDTQVVRGELYAIDEEGLAALDMLEGHPNFYRRRKMWTDKMEKRAWVYFMDNPRWITEEEKHDVVPDGLWNPFAECRKFWNLPDGS